MFRKIHFVFYFLTIAGHLQASQNIYSSTFCPGKNDSDDIFYTQIGKTKIYFFTSHEKKSLAKNFLLKSLHHNNLTLSTKSSSESTSRIVALATKYSDSMRHILDDSTITQDFEGRPIYPDPIGHQIFNDYMSKIKMLTENQLGIKVIGESRDLSLHVNQEGLSLQKEPFILEFNHLKSLSQDLPRFLFFEAIDLIDWQMAPGVFSAYLIQDEDYEDRYLLNYFPGETLGIAYTQSVQYQLDGQLSSEQKSSLYRTAISPIDYLGSLSVGSWKGKNLSTSFKGIVAEEELNTLNQKAILLSIDHPDCQKDTQGLSLFSYPNGICFKQLSTSLPEIILEKYSLLGNQENVTLLESKPKEHKALMPFFYKAFNLKKLPSQVFHVVKEDGGFSCLENIFSNIPSSKEVVIINRSTLPENYKHYILSEDCTNQGKPWIHMYHFPPNQIMKLTGEALKKLSLSPVEEMLFRHENTPVAKTENNLIESITLKIDVFVF